MKKILIALILMLSVCAVHAQQDCGAVDCPGRCGQFVDANGDGFCDRGGLTQPAPAPAPAQKVEKKVIVKTVPAETTPDTDSTTQADTTARFDTIIYIDSTIQTANVPAQQSGQPQKKDPYPVYHILIGLLVLYGVSILLVKKNVWQKATHRKVWNIALTVTFLISCLLGVLLAIFIHHGYYPQTYVDFLHVHVWFGIGMTIIALFHALWHLNYFKAIFKRK